MSYTPNFNDPRVRDRIQRSIGFACGCFSPTKPHEWSTRYIDKWFGSQRNDLSKYIRNELLIVTDHSYSWGEKHKCKAYILNPAGVEYLSNAIGMNTTTTNNYYPIVVEVAQDEYVDELATGDFAYRDQSNRLWHPLQSFRRDAKRKVLESNGYNHHYDIECCAMTLIHQYAQQIPEVILDNKWQQGPMDLHLFALREYLRDRQSIRQQLAQAADIDTDTIKRIINALLAGAKLSKNQDCQIYNMLNGDLARIEYLQQDEYLTRLRSDIKTCWNYITPTLPRRSKRDKNNRERMIAVSSKQKWGVYFDLERRVLNEVREFLCETNNKHFLEHDGWSCEREIDQTSLSQRVFEKTGFRVNFEYNNN